MRWHFSFHYAQCMDRVDQVIRSVSASLKHRIHISDLQTENIEKQKIARRWIKHV